MGITVSPSQFHRGLFIYFLGDEKKYCITWTPQNASLYFSDTYYNGNSALS